MFDEETDEIAAPAPKSVAKPTASEILASAPSVEEVLGKPDVYRAWLAKAQEALNG